jgi:hypothetical protein
MTVMMTWQRSCDFAFRGTMIRTHRRLYLPHAPVGTDWITNGVHRRLTASSWAGNCMEWMGSDGERTVAWKDAWMEVYQRVVHRKWVTA